MKALLRPQAKSGIKDVGSIPPFGIELAPDADLKHRSQRATMAHFVTRGFDVSTPLFETVRNTGQLAGNSVWRASPGSS
ncbi:hypothetical protein [Paraburkholderia eburnea]|uniref:hypothetical protein n=1 Tax=Paraburkholderia eburnea TaxID=1189126 RepID=UPI0011B0BF9C|nr:hypothetical protein [Paraburkholderia eburnea]